MQDLDVLQLRELAPHEQAGITGGMENSLSYQFGHAVGRTAGQIIGGTCAVLGNWAMEILN